MRCTHETKVRLSPRDVGGLPVARCDVEALPGLTTCAQHADPQAVAMAMESQRRRCVAVAIVAWGWAMRAWVAASPCSRCRLRDLARDFLEGDDSNG